MSVYVHYLLLCLYREIKKRRIDELPAYFVDRETELLRKHKFHKLPYEFRAFFIVPLCLSKLPHKELFFDRKSQEWLEFQEIITIRNKIAHAVHVHIPSIVTTNQDFSSFELSNDYPENYWPMTKTNRDIAVFEYKYAVHCLERFDWLQNKIYYFLKDEIPNQFFTDETIQFLKKS